MVLFIMLWLNKKLDVDKRNPHFYRYINMLLSYMSGPKLDLRPGLNLGLPRLNLGQRFKEDPL